jgi:phage FluMu protein Com
MKAVTAAGDDVDRAVTCDEFTCRSCGRLIYSFPPQATVPTTCASCQWIAEFVAPEEQAEMRRRLCV